MWYKQYQIQIGRLLMRKSLLILPLFLFLSILALSACTMIPALASGQPSPTPTDCGCKVPGLATPTGGISLAGPSGPSQDTPTPEGVQTLRDRWETFTNDTYRFTFEYPAAYKSGAYGFCMARQAKKVPEGAQLLVNVGSRTELTVTKTNKDLQSAVDAWKAQHKDYQFEPTSQRTVGGVPALVQPYRSGGTGRYAEATFFVKDGNLYHVEVGSPSACDITDIDLTELSAYAHLLDSFKFQ